MTTSRAGEPCERAEQAEQAEPKISVLVADDNADVLLATADLVMEYPGVLVVSLAMNVEETLRAVRANQPDLVLIDAWLRGGGAEVAAQSVAKISPRTSVVALASAIEPHAEGRFLEAGLFGCFAKEQLSAVFPGILSAIREGRTNVG